MYMFGRTSSSLEDAHDPLRAFFFPPFLSSEPVLTSPAWPPQTELKQPHRNRNTNLWNFTPTVGNTKGPSSITTVFNVLPSLAAPSGRLHYRRGEGGGTPQ